MHHSNKAYPQFVHPVFYKSPGKQWSHSVYGQGFCHNYLIFVTLHSPLTAPGKL